MNNLTEIEEKLIELLPLWFAQHADNNEKNKDFWNSNKTAALLKLNFKNWHHWKNKSKGRAYEKKLKEKQIEEEKTKQLQLLKELEEKRQMDFL